MPRKRTKKSDSSAPSSTGFFFDEAEADRACEFCIKFLTHVKGEWAGRPFELEVWQRELIRNLFGWKRRDGTRKYRKCFVFVARKNGKTTLGAAIALYLLFSDREPGAEIYSVAADRDQAAIMFDVAKGMTANSAELARRCEVFRRTITVPATGSAYHVLSADAPTKHGKNSHAVLFDELHAQPGRDLYDVMKTSMGSRRQPLFLMFTTAGFDRESVCYEEYDYACKIRDSVLKDDTYLPVIHEAEKGDDWGDLATWRKANPSLGVSVKLEFLQEEYRRAQESTAYQNTFRRLYLNQWTEQDVRWLDIDKWDACQELFDLASLAGRPAFIGLDLATTTDLTAEAILFPPENGEPWRCLWRFWLPEENMKQRVTRDRVPYDAWERDGFIELTEGNVTDYDVISARIIEDCELYDVREIVYDRWGATQLITQLQAERLACVPFGQGFASMSAPTKELEKLILSKTFAHNGNLVARWMASNVSVRQDPAGNLKPDKSRSTERIDGIVAAIMALGRAQQSNLWRSGYDDGELKVIG